MSEASLHMPHFFITLRVDSSPILRIQTTPTRLAILPITAIVWDLCAEGTEFESAGVEPVLIAVLRGFHDSVHTNDGIFTKQSRITSSLIIFSHRT